MHASRRSLLAAASAIGSLGATSAMTSSDGGTPDSAARQLAAVSERANDALMRGDFTRYRELVTFTPDFTLMSPFGGEPTHGTQLTEDRLAAFGRFFRNGRLTQEVVQTWSSEDMVALAVIERATQVEVGELPAQDWALRVTLVYRRVGTAWQLAHRHADPLVKGISLAQSAALARGAPEPRP
jgi:ketosteroid isomerase-like protein